MSKSKDSRKFPVPHLNLVSNLHLINPLCLPVSDPNLSMSWKTCRRSAVQKAIVIARRIVGRRIVGRWIVARRIVGRWIVDRWIIGRWIVGRRVVGWRVVGRRIVGRFVAAGLIYNWHIFFRWAQIRRRRTCFHCPRNCLCPTVVTIFTFNHSFTETTRNPTKIIKSYWTASSSQAAGYVRI